MKKLLVLIVLVCSFASGANAETLKVPLSKLAYDATVDLTCILGGYGISIPIPERWKVKNAVLTVTYVNSNTLLKDKSQLVVKLNGSTIKQVSLNPLMPEGKLAVTIPGTLLKSDYNHLSFFVAQHYATQCEQFCSPNLWTTLNFTDSSFEVNYDLKPVPLQLSAISPFLFDPKIWPGGDVNIITEDLSSDAVTQAGLVASGVAVKFDYRKVSFSISKDINPEHDNILVGNKTFVEAFLKQRGIDVTVPGPYLKIMHLPFVDKIKRSAHALLVVSGTSPDEIKMAARTLAHMTLPYPGTDDLVAKDVKMPDIPLYGGRHVLLSDKIYTFKTLDFDTHTFSGFTSHSKDISFRLPPDFRIKQNQHAKMALNFAYGAGMRDDSVVNVMVNDKTVQVVHLKKPSGESVEGYKMDLPTHLFKPGHNVIKFVPVLNPEVKECDLLRPEGFFLTLFGNSSFQFPAMPHFVEMPNLALFMTDGFPFTRMPDGSESLIYLTSPDHETASAALNLIGIMSQKNGYPLSGTKISYEKPSSWSGELIILGDVKSISEEFLDLAPLKLSQTKVVPYPVTRAWEGDASFVISRQLSSLGPDVGVVMEFQSPYKIGRSIFMITGSSEREVLAASTALSEPGVQDGVKGDLVFIDLHGPDHAIKALSAGENYFTGKSGTFFAIEYYFSKYTYLNYVLLFLVVLLLSFLTLIVLRKIRRKRTYADDTDRVD